MTAAATAEPATGPVLASLTRRLTDTPGDFLAEPMVGGRGTVSVAAVVSDLFVAYGAAPLPVDSAAVFRPDAAVLDDPERAAAARNWLQCVLVATWLLHDPWFVARPAVADAWTWLSSGLAAVAGTVAAPTLVADPDRREELARRCLQALHLVPAGETLAQASDRLTTLDSVERARVLADTLAAEQRAAEVRQAMHNQAAAEAAAKASRE